LLDANHRQFVVWPQREGELTAFAPWLTHTHTMRWHAHYHTLGSGHVYQGGFKSFPVQENEQFYHVVRYVERNARRANLIQHAEDWC
jgi:putative transposase